MCCCDEGDIRETVEKASDPELRRMLNESCKSKALAANQELRRRGITVNYFGRRTSR